MKHSIIPTIIVSTLFSAGSALACSNVFITGPGVAAVARTMDMELNTGNVMGYGARGVANVSNINTPQSAPLDSVKWTNRYAYLGQTAFKTYVLTDGLNSQGVYAAFLDLPDVSYYPGYNASDKRPELGLTDIVNYILSTSASVPDALNHLAKVQIVKNAFAVTYQNKLMFAGNPIHIIIRDKLGNSAVLEWTAYKGQPKLHVYVHPAATHKVIETIPGTKQAPIVFNHTDAAVLTNAPSYAWQLNNAAKYNYVFTGNTGRKWDEHYHMNGSGMAGIPGNWTPPGRFARGTQLARLTPAPKTEDQALFLADSVLISSMRVPLGANPAASIWETVSDLKNSVYYFKPLLSSVPVIKPREIKVHLPKFNMPFQAYSVREIAKQNRVPQGWIATQVKPSKMATPAQTKAADKMAYTPTPGNIKPKIKLI
jgi:choloylglycine hydrolase